MTPSFPCIRAALALALACCWLAAGQAQEVAATRVHVTDGAPPAVLAGLPLPAGLQALAVSPDGRRVAIAVADPSAGKSHDPQVRIHGADGSVIVVPIPGLVRDLLFLGNDELFALEHRPAKRGEGESYLARLDLDARRARRELRLPASARALAYLPQAHALLIPSRDELRTLMLPRLQSGPMYRLPGDNLGVASAGGTRLLVGQDAMLLLVDLEDPQERDGLPVRERIAVPAPVVSLALAADGSSGLAALADGRVVTVGFAPLAIEEIGAGLVVERGALPGTAPRPTPTAVPEPRETAAAPPPTSRSPDRQPAPPSPEPAIPPPAQPAPTRTSVQPPPPPPASPVPTEPPRESASVRGLLEGPAASLVVAVVAFGPDSLLHEAARVPPSADGRYAMADLAPGRYRIQLDGGGGRVLVAEPPFLQVEVSRDGEAIADFRVLRGL